MARIVKGGLIQTTLALSSEQPIEAIKKAMSDASDEQKARLEKCLKLLQ